MDRKLIEYLPEWLREFREIKELTDIEQSQSENLWEALEKMWNNNFIESLDEQGCEHWPPRRARSPARRIPSGRCTRWG